MAISTNPKPTIYRNLYENTGPDLQVGDVSVNTPEEVGHQKKAAVKERAARETAMH